MMENSLSTELFENQLSESKITEHQEKSYLTYREVLAEFSGSVEEDPEASEYPDYYGGSYMNENGYLVIQITEPLSECGEIIQEIAKQEHILFESVKTSYKELLQTMDELNAYFLDDEREDKDNVIAFGIDEKYNEVFVELEKCHFDSIQQFKNNICNLDYLSFKEGIRLKIEATTRAGLEIQRPAGISSIAYRAIRNNDQGIIISGHAALGHLGSEMRVENTNTGIITVRQVSGSVDAAFALRGNVNVQQAIGNTNLTHEPALRGFPPNGFPVSQFGRSTQLTHGTIQSLNVTVNVFGLDGRTVTFTNFVRANYHSQGGDSGGPIFERNGTGNRRFIIGVHVASNGHFCRAINVANALGVRIF